MSLLLAAALAWFAVDATIDTTSPLDRIAIIGASASAGWGVVLPSTPPPKGTMALNRHIDLADVVSVVLGSDAGTVTSHTDTLFFATPMKVGSQEVRDAIATDPTIVIAVDFLFWYGYGERDASGERHAQDDVLSRMALLEKGIAAIERFEVPVLVGDLPDVSEAAAVEPISLLKSTQVPSMQALQAMNFRIHAWAANDPNITLVPLADTVDRMVRNVPLRLNSFDWDGDNRLLQFDRLHPTPWGLVALGELAAQSLPPMIKVKTMRCNPEEVLTKLREQAR
jgi:hypothetical protein